MYSVVRIVVACLICVLGIFLVKKLIKSNNKIKYISVVVASVALMIVLNFLPFENLMVKFKSPESVYKYINGFDAQIELVVSGNESDLVVERKKDDSYQYLIVPKAENGWKLDTGKNTKVISEEINTDGSVSIYKYKDTKDYYVVVVGSNAQKYDITDNRQSKFSEIERKVEFSGEVYTTYYAYVDSLDDSYQLYMKETETGDGGLSCGG